MTSADDRRSRPTARRSGPRGSRPGRGRAERRRAAARSRRALRQEAPSTVALLTGGEDFAAMRRYTTFPFGDHREYLDRMQDVLRSLAGETLQISVVRFDPAAFADYCAATGRDPDCPTSRARYTAEVAASRTAVRYRGQSTADLAVQLALEAARRADREYAAQVLAAAAAGPTGAAGAERSMQRARQAVLRLLEAAGPGLHHIVCTVPVHGRPLSAVLHAGTGAGAAAQSARGDLQAFCTVLAAGIATEGSGGVVLRTCGSPGGPGDADLPDVIRGWRLRDGWLHPLTEAEVFDAHCTDAATGEPIPPEPGLAFGAGTPLPPPDPPTGRG